MILNKFRASAVTDLKEGRLCDTEEAVNVDPVSQTRWTKKILSIVRSHQIDSPTTCCFGIIQNGSTSNTQLQLLSHFVSITDVVYIKFCSFQDSDFSDCDFLD